MRAAAAVLLALAAGAVAVRGEESNRAPIRLNPDVRPEKEHLTVTVAGEARLPDGARVHILLVPIGPGDVSGPPLRTAYAEVKGGVFSASPWRVKPSDVKALGYRMEARVADDQPQSLRRALARARRLLPAQAPVELQTWQDRCKKLTPVAGELLDRMAGLTRLRDPLLAMAKRATKRNLTAAEWTGWEGHVPLARAHARCLELLNAPLCVASFPRAHDKGIYLVSTFDGIADSIAKVLLAKEGEGNPENQVILAVAEEDSPPDYLLDFQRVLAQEGARQFVLLLGRALQGLDPAAASGRRPVAEVEKDVRLLFGQFQAFYDLPWTEEVRTGRAPVLEVFDGATKLIDASKATDADAQIQRKIQWDGLQASLQRLMAVLQ